MIKLMCFHGHFFKENSITQMFTFFVSVFFVFFCFFLIILPFPLNVPVRLVPQLVVRGHMYMI